MFYRFMHFREERGRGEECCGREERHHAHFGRHGGRGPWERGFGGGRERFLDPGDLSLLILQLLSIFNCKNIFHILPACKAGFIGLCFGVFQSFKSVGQNRDVHTL